MISLERRAHSYARESKGYILTGSLTFTTTDPIEDEREAADLVKALVEHKVIPVFGENYVSVRSVSFTWTLTDKDRDLYGEQVQVIIHASYVTRVKPLDDDTAKQLIEDYQNDH